MTRAWWKEAVIYQVYPRSFMDSNGDGIGDINGIREKLPYIRELGADAIWICPVFDSPNADNGYDIRDYQSIMPEFGTMDDFDALLTEAHQLGMKLIIDLVINHTSDEHPWFIESRAERNSGKRDWYIWQDGKDGSEPNNWESIFGGSAWTYDEKTEQYYLHLFHEKQPDLNWENSDMRSALYDMINWWLQKGIDGFRVDAISHIKKKEGLPDLPNPEGLSFVPSFAYHMNVDGIIALLQELKENTFAGYPHIMTVGEANGVSAEEAEDWVGESNGIFSMIFQFEHLGLWGIEGGELDLPELKRILSNWQSALEGKGWNALFIENHDQPRAVSVWGDDGKYRVDSAKALAAMYFLMKGTPFIYQGQEIGMTNAIFFDIDDYDDVSIKNDYRIQKEKGRSHEDIMKAVWKKSRDHARTPMQWTDRPNAGFTKGEPWLCMNENYKLINTVHQQHDPRSVYHFYKRLIAIRKRYDVFIDGSYELLLPEDRQIFAYLRKLREETAIVIVNLSARQAFYHHPAYPLCTDGLLLSNADINAHKHLTSFVMKPYEARVYMIRQEIGDL
ncbi:alpha-glucosidase [Bacillus paralicheniformis]|uniref:glycoside hydrolase family 13 protein n=1 Tax=Bacillus TaxID=1386 RepID=UPI000D037C4D|nr:MULTISPECIES: alpha-glucosidase [Bacillus]MBZ5216092.1 alpha-glucosidase [Bacillus paralicheniformis]MCD2368001.1 alpha-glucosidase [Bacillus sp. BS3(2021)]MCJ8229394.1 alpha-glucosidase [Bacillus paralicheniformis]MCY8039537.1 alpha-glucosidase [Bacillus paralicheniformis]MEC4199476.1 alpha-glucosidase [Bacillus sp. AAVF1]